MPTSNEERAIWLLAEEERFLNEPADEEEFEDEEELTEEDDSPIDETPSEKLTRLKGELMDEINNPLRTWN